MTLRSRLLAYFLAALGVVLAGFSASLVALAWTDLHRRADERLNAAIDRLAAAAEVDDEGVEWEPTGRDLGLAPPSFDGAFVWRVTDETGLRLDGSLPRDDDRVLGGAAGMRTVVGRGRVPWIVNTRWVESRASRHSFGKDLRTGPPSGKHERIVITAAASLEGVRADVRNLALATTGLSVGLWVLAFAAGNHLCRRVLSPLTNMATVARSLGEDPAGRLPVPSPRDELRDLGDSFNGLLDRLHESYARQARFTGDASHQLRTPLAAMIGQVEVALRRDRSADEYRHALALVGRRAKNLGQIVETLLFLARSDAEADPPGLAPIDLATFLPEHVRGWSGHPRAADISLDRCDECLVRAQPTMLAALLDNLIDNACKYSAPGTPILVRLTTDGGRASIAVEDRGVGIAADDLPRVFEPFFRSERARRDGAAGTGLGLSVALRLARSLGGTIEAASRPEGGSVFTVSLPCEVPDESGNLDAERSQNGRQRDQWQPDDRGVIGRVDPLE